MALTIIQALKQIKQLGRKIDRNNERIQKWCSYTSDVEPLYGQEEVRAMIQSTGDMNAEIAKLRHALHLVNATLVVKFEEKETTIDELLLEATVVIPARLATLKLLRRQEKSHYQKEEVKCIMQFDPKERDVTIDNLLDRQGRINDFLDTLNITVML